MEWCSDHKKTKGKKSIIGKYFRKIARIGGTCGKQKAFYASKVRYDGLSRIRKFLYVG